MPVQSSSPWKQPVKSVKSVANNNPLNPMPKIKTKEQKTERCWVKLVWLFTLCIMMIAVGPTCATTYKLVRVASVSADNKYVFEQDGYVMNNTISSNTLQTTNSYKTTGLSDTESYVWTLESATDGFYMKNGSQYLNNSSSTNMSLGSKSSIWSFAYQEGDGTFLIQNKSNDNRFLGYTTNTSHVYKAYATNLLSSYPHAIAIYQLVDEEVSAPSHTVTFIANGITVSETSVNEATAITFPENPANNSGKTFVGWAKAAIDGTTNTQPTLYTSAYMGAADVTFYAVYATLTPGSTTIITDQLTATLINQNSYDNWSGKSDQSSARYAGNSTTDTNKAIQIRASENSGIVTTSSGGYARKITVTWSGSNNNKVVDIYGKNTTYSSAADLYDNSKKGTKIGSISNPATELTITGDYAYIGLRSNSGALYLSEIDIDWAVVVPDTYSDYCTQVTPIVTIASSGFATYCCQYPLDLDGLDSNVRAYTVKEISDTTVLFKRITGTIASGVPFILYGKPDITCTLPLTTDSENHPEPNLLIGTLTPTFMSQQEEDYTYFALSATYGDFRKLKDEGMTVPANKAILPVPNSLIAEMSEARMAIAFDDETTGISSMDDGQSSMDNTVYDLQGRRVDASLHHQPGIYLVRGKKILLNK